jgi:hypothetical protein
MDKACNMQEIEEKYIKDVDGKSRRKGTARKT